jgi:hypothetical protein
MTLESQADDKLSMDIDTLQKVVASYLVAASGVTVATAEEESEQAELLYRILRQIRRLCESDPVAAGWLRTGNDRALYGRIKDKADDKWVAGLFYAHVVPLFKFQRSIDAIDGGSVSVVTQLLQDLRL